MKRKLLILILTLVVAAAGLQPSSAETTCDDDVDTDGDKWSDCLEVEHLGTDPNEDDTDGDGIPDGFDLAPLKPSGGSLNIQGASSSNRISMSLVSLDEQGSCEYRDGNYFDPYIESAYLQLPAGAGSQDFTRVGFEEDNHGDGRQTAQLSEPPTAILALPDDIGGFNLEPGAYPSVQIFFKLKEHDRHDDDPIYIGIDGKATLDVYLPVWSSAASKVNDRKWTGSGTCSAEVKFDWTTSLLRDNVIASTLADALKAVTGDFVKVDDWTSALSDSDCTLITWGWDDSTADEGADARVCSEISSEFSVSPEGPDEYDLIKAADFLDALQDQSDPDNHLAHMADGYPN